MEDLTSLMQSIDLISKSIPEGEYLKMCHNMKNLYKVVPRPTSPEAAIHRVLPPLQNIEVSDDDTQLLIPEIHMRDQVFELACTIGQATRQIRQKESRLKHLKLKQRITAAVRKDSVRERAQQLGVRLREYTIEELRAKGHHISNERNFYKSYLDRQNMLTRGLILDLQDEIEEITIYR